MLTPERYKARLAVANEAKLVEMVRETFELLLTAGRGRRERFNERLNDCYLECQQRGRLQIYQQIGNACLKDLKHRHQSLAG